MAEFESRRAFEHMDKLAYEIGPRLAGTRGDRMAGEYVKKQFEGYGLTTQSQDFKFVYRSSRSKATAVTFAAALVASFFLPPVFSLLVWLIALILWRSLDRIMPKVSSQNIMAIREVPSPKKRVAVSAHYDSAPCAASQKLRLFLKFAVLPALASVVVISALRVLVPLPSWPYVWLAQAVFFLPICAGMLLSARRGRISPGADDNASGVAVMLEAARVLAEEQSPDLELRFIAFGAEEQGLVGARSLAKANLLPNEMIVLNLDMVGVGAQAYVIEGNGTLRKSRTSAQVNKALADSITRVGLKPKYWWAALAGHDHIPLVKAGIKATTFSFDTPGVDRTGRRLARLFKLPNARTRAYRYIHTVDDIPDRIELERIEQAGAAVLDFVKTI